MSEGLSEEKADGLKEYMQLLNDVGIECRSYHREQRLFVVCEGVKILCESEADAIKQLEKIYEKYTHGIPEDERLAFEIDALGYGAVFECMAKDDQELLNDLWEKNQFMYRDWENFVRKNVKVVLAAPGEPIDLDNYNEDAPMRMAAEDVPSLIGDDADSIDSYYGALFSELSDDDQEKLRALWDTSRNRRTPWWKFLVDNVRVLPDIEEHPTRSESLLLCEDKQRLNNLCIALNTAAADVSNGLKHVGLDVYAIGRLKKAVRVAPSLGLSRAKGTYFVWWGGEHGPQLNNWLGDYILERCNLNNGFYSLVFPERVPQMPRMLKGIEHGHFQGFQENDWVRAYNPYDNGQFDLNLINGL